MVDENKRNRNSKLIALGIAVLAVIFFVTSFYMGAGTH